MMGPRSGDQRLLFGVEVVGTGLLRTVCGLLNLIQSTSVGLMEN